MLPGLLGFLVFTIFPVLFALGISLHRLEFLGLHLRAAAAVCRLRQLSRSFRDLPIFKQVASNMLFYVAAIVPLQTGSVC